MPFERCYRRSRPLVGSCFSAVPMPPLTPWLPTAFCLRIDGIYRGSHSLLPDSMMTLGSCRVLLSRLKPLFSQTCPDRSTRPFLSIQVVLTSVEKRTMTRTELHLTLIARLQVTTPSIV